MQLQDSLSAFQEAAESSWFSTWHMGTCFCNITSYRETDEQLAKYPQSREGPISK